MAPVSLREIERCSGGIRRAADASDRTAQRAIFDGRVGGRSVVVDSTEIALRRAARRILSGFAPLALLFAHASRRWVVRASGCGKRAHTELDTTFQ
eukprot:5350730-Prymnesium_polylepis.1